MIRRSTIKCLLFALFSFVATFDASAHGPIPVYFGTYTRGQSQGIYQARLDLHTGKLGSLQLVAEVENPSFLAFHPGRPLLYAAGELAEFQGGKAGAVSAFKRNTITGELTLLGQQPSGGAQPCHVSVTPCGKYVLAANYSGGNVACYPVNRDGSLGPMSGFVQHEGSSVNPRRQQGPHAHSFNPDPAGRFFFAADLGIDKILIYRIEDDALVANDPAFVTVAPGSGPRHFTFHPRGRFAYVINELLSTVTAFSYDAQRGSLTEIQIITTLPEGFDGKNSTAEVQVHPSGKFLYGSNRGHNSLAVFSIDQQTGKLTPLGHTSTEGETPRNFAVDPTGLFILAANQATNNVVVLRVNQDDGTLESTGNQLEVGSPVCVKFPPHSR